MGKFIISFRYCACVLWTRCRSLIPAHWLEAIGVNNHLYHIGAVYIGSIFGIITLVGMFLLTARRVTKANVRRLSSASDILVNFYYS